MKKVKKNDDLKQCPKCGYRFESGNYCPRCNYNGYFPLTTRQTMRIKWILYPIVLAAAILVLLATRGVFSK